MARPYHLGALTAVICGKADQQGIPLGRHLNSDVGT
jgi:hypothetical protein